MRISLAILLLCSAFLNDSIHAAVLPPDITVAADGSGDFTSIQQAVQSIPKDNHQRIVILIKDGVYKEKVRLDASCVTLRGQSRQGARIEFAILYDDYRKKPDNLGRGVLNIYGDDAVLENLTVQNTYDVAGHHEFSVYGTGTRTIIVDSDILSEGNDTLSLWCPTGMYYHARCNFRGSVDFVCPRGWCYLTDCNFAEARPTASVWHDGHLDKDMKYVLHNCKFKGVDGFVLARHHIDAQFYFLDCAFAKNMADRPPLRVVYPLSATQPTTAADVFRNKQNDKENLWGERSYFFNCHRDGGDDFAWFKDNLSAAPGSPKPEHVTAAWTFAGKWDPENPAGPKILKIERKDQQISVTFAEAVTVKGKPRAILSDGSSAAYSAGSGTDTLIFTASASGTDVKSVDLNGGWIVACEANAAIRNAELALPS